MNFAMEKNMEGSGSSNPRPFHCSRPAPRPLPVQRNPRSDIPGPGPGTFHRSRPGPFHRSRPGPYSRPAPAPVPVPGPPKFPHTRAEPGQVSGPLYARVTASYVPKPRSLEEEMELKRYSEQVKLYSEQVRDSEGFHVDFCPRHICAGIVPVSESCLPDCDRYAIFAINCHNYSHKDQKLEFLSILNATCQLVDGVLFYLTFRARSDAGVTKVYQAKVLRSFLLGKDVLYAESFRVKPPPSTFGGSTSSDTKDAAVDSTT